MGQQEPHKSGAASGGSPLPLMVSPLILCLLCTGCSVALLSQHLTHKGVALAHAQIPAWTKYNFNFLLSWALESLPHLFTRSAPGSGMHAAVRAPAISRRQSLVLAAMGLLDVMGYGLNCLGFVKCGAALSMVLGAAAGQICTALTRRLILQKPLSIQQYTAVATVSVGLIIRGLDGISWRDPLRSRVDANMAAGVLLIVMGSLSYSLLGVAYEWLMQLPESSVLTQAQINRRMAWVGALAISAYQVAFTWPRRHRLVFQQLHDSGLAAAHVLLLYLLFGGIFTVHSHVQGHMLGRHGAVSVGIVNAMRAVVVSISSAALFCRPGSTSQCLTLTSGTSAVVVTAGAMLWATAPRAKLQGKTK